MGKQKRKVASKQKGSSKRSGSTNSKSTSMKKKESSSYFTDDEELANFQKQLEPMGLMIRDVQGDGNCLFRALGDQLDGHDRNHLQHREETVHYISEHRSDFEPFMEDGIPFDQHVSNMSQPGTHAGNDALVAFARLHKVIIIIHQLGLPPWQIEGTNEKGARQLHISYHNGEHYASVRKIGDGSELPTSVHLTDCHKEMCVHIDECKDESCEESSPPTESSTEGSDVGLWAPDGTGTRLFGKVSKTVKKSESKGKTKLPNRSQKKDTKRQKSVSPKVSSPNKETILDEKTTVVVSRDLSLLRI